MWCGESSVTLPNSKKALPYGTSNDLIRILENAFNKSVGPLQRVTMNHWLSFSLILDEEIPKSVEYLDKILGPLTYLVGESLTVSDLAVFSVLYGKYLYEKKIKNQFYNKIHMLVIKSYYKTLLKISSLINCLYLSYYILHMYR